MDWSVGSFLTKVKWPEIAFDSKAFTPASDINTLSLFVSRRGLPFLITTFSTHGHLPAGVAKFLKIVKIKGENRVRLLAVKLYIYKKNKNYMFMTSISFNFITRLFHDHL